MLVGLVQLNAGDMPLENLPITEGFIREAAGQGAKFILTPEVTNIISSDREHQNAVLQLERDDQTLERMVELAAELGIWLLVGSLALKSPDPDTRFANRSFLIGPKGRIVERYNKIHMFNVALSETETWQESAAFRAGNKLVVAKTAVGNIGMSICYDVRFPHLYRDLAKAGAGLLAVPSAFTQTTGEAHWEVLLRARAIENGCFVLAPAQCGHHSVTSGAPRSTYGHSLAVSPWGEVLADGGTEPGVTIVEIDRNEILQTRRRIPSLRHDVQYNGA